MAYSLTAADYHLFAILELAWSYAHDLAISGQLTDGNMNLAWLATRVHL